MCLASNRHWCTIANNKNNKKVAASQSRSQKNNTGPRRKTLVFTNSNATSRTMPVALLTRNSPSAVTTTSRQSGKDLLQVLSTSTTSSYPLGSAVMEGLITAETSLRLSTLARAYQRIRWTALRFTIEASYSSLSGGGFIACFVQDPSDRPPEDPQAALQWAMAQQYSVDSKWWDSTQLIVSRDPDLLWTSVTDDAERLYSPGKFVVVSKGGPGQVGSLTVSFEWTVVLSEPTIENTETPVASTWKPPVPIYAPFGLPTGAYLAQKCTSTHPDPSLNSYAALDAPADLEDGVFLRFKTPRTVDGQYQASSMVSPVNMTGMVVMGGYLLFVYQQGARRYVLGTTPFSVPPNYFTSNWAALNGGGGELVGTTEDVFIERGWVDGVLMKAARTPVRVFRNGRQMLQYHDGTYDEVPHHTPDDSMATVALTGEQ